MDRLLLETLKSALLPTAPEAKIPTCPPLDPALVVDISSNLFDSSMPELYPTKILSRLDYFQKSYNHQNK